MRLNRKEATKFSIFNTRIACFSFVSVPLVLRLCWSYVDIPGQGFLETSHVKSSIHALVGRDLHASLKATYLRQAEPSAVVHTSENAFVLGGAPSSITLKSTYLRQAEPSAVVNTSENAFVVGGAPSSIRESNLPKGPSQKHAEKTTTNYTEWVASVDCFNGFSLSCSAACVDQGMRCHSMALRALNTGTKMQEAVTAAGGYCKSFKDVKLNGKWDGPHVQSLVCSYNSHPSWETNCELSPSCGWSRICPCIQNSKTRLLKANRYKTLRQKPLNFWDISSWVPAPTSRSWESETTFLGQLLRSFGRLRLNYAGPERQLGLDHERLFDLHGMFAFDESVTSLALDIGAANKPDMFDLVVDSSQVVFVMEPLQWITIQDDFERDARALKKGGCGIAANARKCANQRVLVLPAAASSKSGYATLRVPVDPQCSSLEEYIADNKRDRAQLDKALRTLNNPAINSKLEACYSNKFPVKVATLPLSAILKRVPKRIVIKFLKIDARGHDFKVVLSAGEHIARVEKLEIMMQVDPPPGRQLTTGLSDYKKVKLHLESHGLKHDGTHACRFEKDATEFSQFVKEMKCVFCRHPPCGNTHV